MIKSQVFTVGWLLFILVGCSEKQSASPTHIPTPNPNMSVRLFEGFYVSAPNVSSFVPCAMDELPEAGKGYWLIPNDDFSQQYEHPEGITYADIGITYGLYDEFAIYVRFEGILFEEPDNGYGHSGLYAGEVQVIKSLEVSRRWVGSSYPPKTFRGCAN